MSDQYVGEIRWFTYVRGAPDGWLPCNGAQVSISVYETLYTLLGTTYGGDGQTTFCVPDLQGRIPLHQGAGPGLTPRVIGEKSGFETITLTTNQLGGHSHVIEASTIAATSTTASGNILATIAANDALYTSSTAGASPVLLPCTGPSGGGQPHVNCAPTLTLLPCIAYAGIYPSQN